MLSREQLKNYRELRKVSMRQLTKYCDLSLAMISYLESGQRQLTKKNHDELIKGINAAYQARKIKQKTDKTVKTDKEDKKEVQDNTKEEATIKEDKQEIKTKEKETKKTKELGKLKEAREKLTRRSKSENKQ